MTQSQAKVKSSQVIVSGFEHKLSDGKDIQLSHEFIVLPIDRGNETLSLSLSFKHITKIEFLDNSDSNGGGLVLYINEFMANKLKSYLEGSGRRLDCSDHYAPSKRLIILDILNCDSQSINAIRLILHEAGLFRHNYLVQQMNRIKKARVEIPMQYITYISHSQWLVLLGTFGKTVFYEDTAVVNQGQGLRTNSYMVCSRIGKICDRATLQFTSVTIPPTSTLQAYSSFSMSRDSQAPALSFQPLVNKESPTSTLQAYSSISMSSDSQAPALSFQPLVNKESPTSSAQPSIKEEPPALSFQPAINKGPITTLPAQLPSTHKEPPAQLIQASLLNGSKFNGPPTLPVQVSIQNGTTTLTVQPSIYKGSPAPVLPTSAQTLTPKGPKQPVKREVHLIEDEDEAIQNQSKMNTGTIGNNQASKNNTIFSYPADAKDNCSVHYSDLKFLALDVMLNDTIIDFYLKYIHHSLVPVERRSQIHVFNTFFYSRLLQPPPHGKQYVTEATKIRRIHANFKSVKNWTKKIDLFEKDYIVVPINEDIHWYLAIIVNVKAGIFSKSSQSLSNNNYSELTQKALPPYIIVLNSLIDPALDKHIDIRNQLAEYLQLEYMDKRQKTCEDTLFSKDMLKVVQPTLVPQQKGYIDCGLFLLHFAELFLTNPPKEITNRSCFRKWYKLFGIRHKRAEIQNVIRSLAPQVKLSDFIYYAHRPTKTKGRRPGKAKPSVLEAFPMMGRERRQSESRLDELAKDPRFSVLYRPRSLDSLLVEHKDKPLLLQPPTKEEMKRYKKVRIYDDMMERINCIIAK